MGFNEDHYRWSRVVSPVTIHGVIRCFRKVVGGNSERIERPTLAIRVLPVQDFIPLLWVRVILIIHWIAIAINLAPFLWAVIPKDNVVNDKVELVFTLLTGTVWERMHFGSYVVVTVRNMVILPLKIVPLRIEDAELVYLRRLVSVFIYRQGVVAVSDNFSTRVWIHRIP